MAKKGRGTVKETCIKTYIRATNHVKKLWLSDPTWPPKGDLEKAIWRLISARVDVYAAEWKLSPRRVRGFPGGWLLILPDDKDGVEAGSVVITRAITGLGERIKFLPERMKPVAIEVIALAEQIVPVVVESFIDVYENGDVLNACFFAIRDNQWMCTDLEHYLRFVAEDVLRAGGPIKAYREDCRETGETGDLHLFRLYKKSIELYLKGAI